MVLGKDHERGAPEIEGSSRQGLEEEEGIPM